jgi:hypothetical protein
MRNLSLKFESVLQMSNRSEIHIGAANSSSAANQHARSASPLVRTLRVTQEVDEANVNQKSVRVRGHGCAVRKLRQMRRLRT